MAAVMLANSSYAVTATDGPVVISKEITNMGVSPNDKYMFVEEVLKAAGINATLPAISRHATFESAQGKIAFTENEDGVLEGILSPEPMIFWLDTADSERNTPYFYISKDIVGAEDMIPAMRNFLYYPVDSSFIWDKSSGLQSKNPKFFLEGTSNINLKAVFRPAALIAEDKLMTFKDGKEVIVAESPNTAKGYVKGLDRFQFSITLADEDVQGEYVIKPKAANVYLYSLNGRLGYIAWKNRALVVTLGEGDATVNNVLESKPEVVVVPVDGGVNVQNAAGAKVVITNILGQTIVTQVATSDNMTVITPAGIMVVAVNGKVTKVIVK